MRVVSVGAAGVGVNDGGCVSVGSGVVVGAMMVGINVAVKDGTIVKVGVGTKTANSPYEFTLEYMTTDWLYDHSTSPIAEVVCS
jgi:hypothetical protein